MIELVKYFRILFLSKQMVRKKMNGDRMELEKGSLESGVYFVRVRAEERQWAGKIVVE